MRVFVGIELPPRVRARLVPLQAGVPGARWIAPENLHLTLHFIGEVDSVRRRDVDQALGSIVATPFPLRLAGVGEFGSRRGSRALWAGLAPSEDLAQVQERIGAALARNGIETERRKFVPHVTLAWLTQAPSERVGAYMVEHSLLSSEEWTVDRVVLYSSHSGSSGNDYRVEGAYPFLRWHDDPEGAAASWSGEFGEEED